MAGAHRPRPPSVLEMLTVVGQRCIALGVIMCPSFGVGARRIDIQILYPSFKSTLFSGPFGTQRLFPLPQVDMMFLTSLIFLALPKGPLGTDLEEMWCRPQPVAFHTTPCSVAAAAIV